MNSRGIKQVFDITFSLLELRSASGLLFIIYFVWYTLGEFFDNIITLHCFIVFVEFNYFYKIAVRDHLYVPKFWRTWFTWAYTKKQISGVIPFT